MNISARLLSLAAFSVLPFLAGAQETVRFGLQVLPSISWFSSNADELDGDQRFNFSFGLLADFMFSERYAITSGLNITKDEDFAVFLAAYRAGWLEPALRAFGPDQVVDWCRGLGQDVFVGSSGRVFLKKPRPERPMGVRVAATM
jgi:hypothetical protein